MCKIQLIIDTGYVKPHVVVSIVPKSFDDRLCLISISNLIYNTGFFTMRKTMRNKAFLSILNALKLFLESNEQDIKGRFKEKPELHFMSCIDFLERSKVEATRHPKTKVIFV